MSEEQDGIENFVDETATDLDAENQEQTATEGEKQPEVEAASEEESEENAEEGAEEEAGEGDDEEGSGEPAYKPNVVFKAGVYNKDSKQLEQKEFSIDPKFHSIMKDAESEKLVRELHEKAYGLDSVKDRYNEAKAYSGQVVQENNDIKSSINRVRTIYNGAIKSGNWHKLDDFFAALDVPQEHILKYALAKVELTEMDPQQRQAVMDRLEADRRAEKFQQEQIGAANSNEELLRENTHLQVDFVLGKPEVSALAEAFDQRAGKPGAFKEAVFREGNLAWNSGEKLGAGEAVQRVIKNYGLDGGTATSTQAQAPASPGQQAPKKPVVQRTTQTIPNVGSRSASPIPTKPKSLDDVIKYRKETHGF